jgi:hypothetical protein
MNNLIQYAGSDSASDAGTDDELNRMADQFVQEESNDQSEVSKLNAPQENEGQNKRTRQDIEKDKEINDNNTDYHFQSEFTNTGLVQDVLVQQGYIDNESIHQKPIKPCSSNLNVFKAYSE